jgi:hypothetical protein
MTNDWLTFDDPRFEVRLRHPSVTPGGEPVERIESRPGDALRVHIRSDSREAYVELTRYPPMPAEEEYGRHKPYLEERFGAGAVTPLTKTEVASWPAQTYAFAWPGGERTVLLLRTATATYRVIANSGSPLNHQIIDTIEVRERDGDDGLA